MKISVHFVTSVLLTAVLWPFIGSYSLWAIVGGFLIDFDHYIYSIFMFKTISLKKACYYHLNIEKQHVIYKKWGLLHIFHTIEFLILMIVLLISANGKKFLFYMFSVTFLGIVLHLILDFVDGIIKKKLDRRALSLIQWFRVASK